MTQMSDSGFKVQAVLVEADEEEDVEECDQDKPETGLVLFGVTTETTQTETQEEEEEGEEEEHEEVKEEEEQEEDQDREKEEEEEVMGSEKVTGSEEEIDPVLVEGLEEIRQDEEEESEEDVEEIKHSGDIHPHVEPAEVSEEEEESMLAGKHCVVYFLFFFPSCDLLCHTVTTVLNVCYSFLNKSNPIRLILSHYYFRQ